MQNFYKNWFDKPRIICGIMSGTSFDGIDVALCDFFIDENKKHRFELLAFDTLNYPKEIKELLFNITKEKVLISDISFINYCLADLHIEAISILCNKANLKKNNIDAIGIHGQTIWHEPNYRKFHKYHIKSSLQLTNSSVISTKLLLPVVSDFRAADLALGGQGAPLVPIFDYEFLRDKHSDIIALNIGGISNITYIPKNQIKENILAFDTGPGNVLIDLFIKKYFNQEYDKDGEIASKGKVFIDLFELLKENKYLDKAPPKSTGRELFNEEFINNILSKIHYSESDYYDIITTLTKFTAWSIAYNIKKFANPLSKIIVSGGGLHNTTLFKMLKNELPESVIISSDDINIPSDAKEAICFAYLAYRTLGGLTSNIPSVTGAEREAILGSISIP